MSGIGSGFEPQEIDRNSRKANSAGIFNLTMVTITGRDGIFKRRPLRRELSEFELPIFPLFRYTGQNGNFRRRASSGKAQFQTQRI
jgi:hypothetical protein